MAEDYTTYTEVDPNNRYSVAATKITITGVTRNETAYVSSDKGAGYFTSFDGDGIQLDGICTSDVNRSDMYIWALTNTEDGLKEIDDLNEPNISMTFNKSAGGTRFFYIIQRDPALLFDSFNYLISTRYYFTVTRNAAKSTYTAKVYSDALRTILVDTLTVAGASTDDYQFIFGANTYNDGFAAAASGDSSNLNLADAVFQTAVGGAVRAVGFIVQRRLMRAR